MSYSFYETGIDGQSLLWRRHCYSDIVPEAFRYEPILPAQANTTEQPFALKLRKDAVTWSWHNTWARVEARLRGEVRSARTALTCYNYQPGRFLWRDLAQADIVDLVAFDSNNRIRSAVRVRVPFLFTLCASSACIGFARHAGAAVVTTPAIAAGEIWGETLVPLPDGNFRRLKEPRLLRPNQRWQLHTNNTSCLLALVWSHSRQSRLLGYASYLATPPQLIPLASDQSKLTALNRQECENLQAWVEQNYSAASDAGTLAENWPEGPPRLTLGELSSHARHAQLTDWATHWQHCPTGLFRYLALRVAGCQAFRSFHYISKLQSDTFSRALEYSNQSLAQTLVLLTTPETQRWALRHAQHPYLLPAIISVLGTNAVPTTLILAQALANYERRQGQAV